MHSPFEHFKMAWNGFPLSIISQYLKSVNAGEASPVNGFISPFPFVLDCHNVALGCVGIRFLDGYRIEFVTQPLVVFSCEWLRCELPIAHSPCIEGWLQVQLVFGLDWRNGTRVFAMVGADEREDGPNDSRARDEEAWETHLDQPGEGRDRLMYCLEEGRSTGALTEGQPARLFYLE